MRACESPRTVPSFGQVRCGRCVPCRDLRNFLKRSRIGLEQADHEGEKAWFCTLTFANTNPNIAEKETYGDVQLWLKRVRATLARAGILEKGLRYIGVAEFGSANQRLHYHVLLWSPVPFRQRDIASWHRGHFQYRVADESRWEYLVKYLQKQSGSKIRGSTKLGHEHVAKTACHPMVGGVLAHFPGSRIQRIGGHLVPRDIGNKHVHLGPPRDSSGDPIRTEDERFSMGLSDSDLRDQSVSESYVGIPDRTWKKMITDHRKLTGDIISGKRPPSTWADIENTPGSRTVNKFTVDDGCVERAAFGPRNKSGNRGGVPPDSDSD